MGKFIDLTGQKFGRLTAISSPGKNKHDKRIWLCRCDCGKEIFTIAGDLKSGQSTSCGCLRKETTSRVNAELHRKHGMNGTRIYQCWGDMKRRCYNQNAESYKHYGGRGIEVCAEWHDFQTFYDWATKNGYSDDLTIERVDVNGNYEPSNCTWIPKSEQPKNRRRWRRSAQ